MKKLTTSILAVVLSSAFTLANAQEDSTKTEKIEEVVVTALGVKREKKALGYASQEVKGDILSNSRQVNAVSGLSGNVAGLQVTAPSSMGGSSRIVLRGVGSVTGENRPLIVVDGVPLSNENNNSTETQRGGGGRDYGDASFDLNPDDIESVNVLKGGAAAALYGSRAANGVILYTTKSGKKGRSEITFNTGITLESVYIMPDLQREYGGGFGDFEVQNINGKDYNIPAYAVDESWGPKYDPNLLYLPWNAFDPEFAEDYLRVVPWVAPENDVKSFFRTGTNINNNISFTKSFNDLNLRVSYGNNAIEGVIPNSKLDKSNFSLNSNAKLSDKLKFESTFNYVVTTGFNRPEQGYGDNSVAQKFFQWGQRQLDFEKLKDYKLANGKQRTWNRTSWDDATPVYSDNPYWTVYENISNDKRRRTFGSAGLTYNISNAVYAVGKFYADTFSFSKDERVAVGSQAQSYFEVLNRNFSEYNYEGRLHFDKKFFEGDFNLFSFVGVNRREEKSNFVYGSTVGGLVIPNFYNLSNSAEQARGENGSTWRRVNSLFGLVSMDYKGYIFLEATGRQDWFSTVTKAVFYPSLSTSFVFNKFLNADWINFAKVKGSWGKTGNDTAPYSIGDYYNTLTPFNGAPRYSNLLSANNPNLLPELTRTKEIGLEMKMFKNRFGFDLALYDKLTSNLITPVDVDPATGFTSVIVNAGEMQNKGIEATVFATPIRSNDFSWNVDWNFAKNNNELLSLFSGETLNLVNAPFKVRLLAQVGARYGQIFGTDFVYDAAGNKVVDATGRYKVSAIKALGSVIPDYNMGIRNTFKYKNFNLSVLLDRQKGGNYYSLSHTFGMYSGMLQATVENGIRENGIVLPGVKENGTVNDIAITAVRYGADHYSRVDAQNVFDASYWKLREVTLSYDFPKSLFDGKIEGIRLTLFGRNLLAWDLAWKGMDPEMASYGSGNIQGLEGGSLPSTRTYGVNVQFKF